MKIRTHPGMAWGPEILRAPEDEGSASTAPASDPPAPAGDPPADAVADPVPEDDAAGEASAPGDGEPAAASGAEGEDEAPKRTPWQVKRIATLTAEKAKLTEERDALRALAASGGASTPAPEPIAAPSGAPAGDRVYTEAEVGRLVALKALDDKLEGLFDQVTATDPKFPALAQQVGSAFGDELKKRPDLFQAVLKLPNPGDTLRALYSDMDRLGEVLAMNGVELGMELASISSKAPKAGARTISRVPAPITPLDETHHAEVPLDKAPMGEFVKTREAQREARMKAKYG